jgi:hypothetical protein
MKRHQLRALFVRPEFQKLMKYHQVTFLHISWGMLSNLVYGQEASRYKLQYMQGVAYILYSEVISNYIIISVAYLFILLTGSLLLLPYSESVLFPISLYIQFLIYWVMDLTHYLIILTTIIYVVNSISNISALLKQDDTLWPECS